MFRFFKKKKPKLIMTLLARDEGDIIRHNIEFHLKNGVDFIIATDNASTDNTRDILIEYKNKKKLYLIDEPERTFSQAAWNNRMSQIAIDRHGADIIFHCDADEFWCPNNGDLKSEIGNSSANVLIVNLINVLLEYQNGNESFPQDAKYAVTNPIETADYEEDSKKDNFYFFKYPPKVMLKTDKGLLEVSHGNHHIVSPSVDIKYEISRNIEIYHFPIRGKAKFYHKVIKSGQAIEQNILGSKSQGFHIRRWYNSYKNGALDLEYEKLTISKMKGTELINKGMIEYFDFENFITR